MLRLIKVTKKFCVHCKHDGSGSMDEMSTCSGYVVCTELSYYNT